MKTFDYSQFPVGTMIDKCEIQLCPHCGKTGLAERIRNTTFFMHFQAWATAGIHHGKTKWDWCPRAVNPTAS
jgi:hypothetical protein